MTGGEFSKCLLFMLQKHLPTHEESRSFQDRRLKNSMILDYFYGQAGELFSFYRIPKALFQGPRFQSLSTDAKTLYGILLDRMSLSVKNGWLDEQNRVFILFTIPDHAHRRIKAPQRIPVGIKYSAIPMAFDGIRMAPNR